MKTDKRRSHTDFWVKLAVVCALIFFFIASIKMNIDINNLKTKVNDAKDSVEQKKLEIEKIKDEIDNFELSEETIKKIAKEKLGLRESDTIIFENSQPN